MEMTDRKKQILKIVVEEYVAAAEPVGSKAIAQRMPGKISSATIRNELADLVVLISRVSTMCLRWVASVMPRAFRACCTMAIAPAAWGEAMDVPSMLS